MALIGLAPLGWPAPAGASTRTLSLDAQGAVALLSRTGAARVTATLTLPTGTATTLRVLLYPRLVTRSALDPLLTGGTPSTTPVSASGVAAVTCDAARPVTVEVDLSAGGQASGARCTARALRLVLPCRGAACDGVYPLEYVAGAGATAQRVFSLVTVRSARIASRLRVAVVIGLDPSALTRARAARHVLDELAHHGAVPLAITADYRTLEPIDTGASATTAAWRHALDAALASPLHRAVVVAPGNVDYGALYANGLRGQVARQLSLSSDLLRAVTGRFTDAPVVVEGHPTVASLTALAAVGARDVVLDEPALAAAPSTTLTWGAPFHVAGVGAALDLATDQGLSAVPAQSGLGAGQRAALLIGGLNFLHFEAPDAASPRTVVLTIPASRTSARTVGDLLAGLARDPYVEPVSLTPLFDAALVGTDDNPPARTLGPPTPSAWSAANRSTLVALAAQVSSFAAAIPTAPEAMTLRVALASAETLGPPTPRQSALEGVASKLAVQTALFSVDDSAVTLTGAGTDLPVTVYSNAHYTVDVVLHLITDRMSFPGGPDVPATLNAPIKSLRVATAHHQGSSLNLQVVLTTPDGRVTLARAAIPVRIAGASLVGYLLTAGSVAVLLLWWYRTNRPRAKGRHAR
ncbi:MAG TPA: hypothetical protein VGS61_07200 [Acidimicrobiales bacterium]|nr:hypothetical protein [Acidimicrobiales bacterium]